MALLQPVNACKSLECSLRWMHCTFSKQTESVSSSKYPIWTQHSFPHAYWHIQSEQFPHKEAELTWKRPWFNELLFIQTVQPALENKKQHCRLQHLRSVPPGLVSDWYAQQHVHCRAALEPFMELLASALLLDWFLRRNAEKTNTTVQPGGITTQHDTYTCPNRAVSVCLCPMRPNLFACSGPAMAAMGATRDRGPSRWRPGPNGWGLAETFCCHSSSKDCASAEGGNNQQCHVRRRNQLIFSLSPVVLDWWSLGNHVFFFTIMKLRQIFVPQNSNLSYKNKNTNPLPMSSKKILNCIE